MAFDDVIRKQRAEDKKRGYRISEMRKIEEKIIRDRREWTRRFNGFVEGMLYHADTKTATELVRYARELADAEAAEIADRFADEPELEE